MYGHMSSPRTFTGRDLIKNPEHVLGEAGKRRSIYSQWMNTGKTLVVFIEIGLLLSPSGACCLADWQQGWSVDRAGSVGDDFSCLLRGILDVKQWGKGRRNWEVEEVWAIWTERVYKGNMLEEGKEMDTKGRQRSSELTVIQKFGHVLLHSPLHC